MGQLPSILKEPDAPDAPLHIGGVLSGDETLCKKSADGEMDLIGWISGREWKPNERFCLECADLYGQGLAWKPPSARG